MIGRRIGSWILQRELGRGGMGAVYEAHHASLRTRAAVKVLSPGLESEESFRQRFHREADLQAQLRHSNVARVLDYLEDGGQWFLIVEFLERGSLQDLLARGESFTREQAIQWIQQAAAGLGHAHQHGIVHRDVKPANLMLSANGEIVVVDFGIARSDGTPGLTATGVSIGTPQYMSPEQIVTPDRVDFRTDIYSLGIVLYELLAGRKPFDADSQFSVLQAHVSSPPPPLRAVKPDIAPALEAAVLRAMAKKPDDRYPDCAAMARELEHAQTAPAPVRAAEPVLGGTVQARSLYEEAPTQNLGGPSADDIRNRKRRSFQRSLLLVAAATILVGSVSAYRLANAEPESEPIVSSPPTITAPSTTTTAAEAPHNEANVTPRHKQPRAPVSQPVDPPVQKLPPVVAPPVTQTTPVQVPPAQAMPAMQPLPARPRVAVIGKGKDQLLAGALEMEMERRLSSRYDVSDELGDPDVQELLEKKEKGKDVSFKELGAQLLKSGFHILVFIQVDEAESRKFELGGVAGNVKAARMRMNAYLLPANRTLGSWVEPIEYTEGSAEPKARMAFIGPTADLRAAIDNGWAQLRAGAAR